MPRTLPAFVLVALVLNLVPAAVKAQPEARLVAVLPFAPGHGVKAVSKSTFEETIRTIAGDFLTPRGFVVLTGDNTLAILEDNGIDPDQACEASCALEAARELQAQLFISGSLVYDEGFYVAFVRLYSVDGRQLASVKLEGEMVRELRAQFSENAEEFFGNVVNMPAAAPARGSIGIGKVSSRTVVYKENEPPTISGDGRAAGGAMAQLEIGGAETALEVPLLFSVEGSATERWQLSLISDEGASLSCTAALGAPCSGKLAPGSYEFHGRGPRILKQELMVPQEGLKATIQTTSSRHYNPMGALGLGLMGIGPGMLVGALAGGHEGVAPGILIGAGVGALLGGFIFPNVRRQSTLVLEESDGH